MPSVNQKQNASVFDIIGPNMVGPSSSHTAGALRISLLASRLVDEPLAEATFRLYGSFARTYHGHGTDKALVAGILGLKTDDLRVRESFDLAQEAGLVFQFIPDYDSTAPHPNTVDITLVTVSGKKTTVQGISIGGGQAIITKLNDMDVELSGNYDTLVVEHWDRPGVIARLTTHFSDAHINIAALKLYRESRGSRAFAIIEADETIPKAAALAIAEDKDVERTLRVPRLSD